VLGGDIQCAVVCEDKSIIVIFEFKRCGNAMDQMKNKGFLVMRHTVIFVAINITKDRKVEVLIERNVGR
jgi:hypothetical protein